MRFNQKAIYLSVLCLVLAPFFSNYKLIESVSIGDALVAIFFSFYLFALKVVRWKSGTVIIAGYLILIFIAFIENNLFEVNAGFFRLCFYSFICLVIPFGQLNDKLFWVFVEKLSLFFSISVLLQFFAQQMGYSLLLSLPIDSVEQDTLSIIDHVYRSGGWFREPSYLVLFLTPFLLYQSSQRQWFKFSIGAVASVISTSSLAVFVLIAIFIKMLFSPNTRSVERLGFIFVFAACTGWFLFNSGNIFVDRVFEIFADGGTLNERFMPIIENFGSIYSFWPSSVAYNNFLELSRVNQVWFSSASNLLASLGLSGLILFIAGISRTGVIYFFFMICIIFTTHVVATSFSIYLILALHYMHRRRI